MRIKARVLFIALSGTLCLMTILAWWRGYNATTVAAALSATRALAGYCLGQLLCGAAYFAWKRTHSGRAYSTPASK